MATVPELLKLYHFPSFLTLVAHHLLPIVAVVAELVYLQKAHQETRPVKLAIVLVVRLIVGVALIVQVQRPAVMPKII